MYMYLLFLVVFMIFFIKAVSMSHSKYFHSCSLRRVSRAPPFIKDYNSYSPTKSRPSIKSCVFHPHIKICVLSHYKRLLLLCPSEANCCRPRRLWSRARGTTLSAGCAEAWTGAWTWWAWCAGWTSPLATPPAPPTTASRPRSRPTLPRRPTANSIPRWA